MDWSGHGKEASERGALTPWRMQMDALFKIWKGRKRERGAHELESAERWTSQDMERNRASQGYSLAGERIGMH
jgi:hypothetical protein